jgi:hypothetical protein
MAEIFLTREEVAQLTNRLRPAAQARVLRFMGVEHRIRPDRSLAVMRAHVEKLFCGEPSAASAKAKSFEPNWSAM